MAQLFFHFGTMNCGKSIEILKVAHNYREQGKEVLLFSSGLDNRFGEGVIASRIGISESCYLFDGLNSNNLYCVLVDECQFLTEEQVNQLTDIVDIYNIPVMAFGLSTDFQSNLFVGSKRLFEVADKINPIKTVCWLCDKKANFNLRVIVNKAVFDGDQIAVGLNGDVVNESDIGYYPVCRKHYKEAKQGKELFNNI